MTTHIAQLAAAHGPIDIDAAVRLGKFIEAAYNQFENASDVLNPAKIPQLPDGYTIVRTIQMKDFTLEPLGQLKFYGFIAKGGQPERQVIALRGTGDLVEWWNNLEFLPTSFTKIANGGKVGEGFFELYQTLQTMDPAHADAAPTPLLDCIDSDLPIVITGHSLGAAAATLLAADMAANHPNLHPELWTFASPKVGDANFAAMYNFHSTVSWRIYNLVDIVPKVPLDPFDEYQHVNTGYAINSTGVARWSIPCAHHLSTYLHMLSPQEPLDHNCQSATGKVKQVSSDASVQG
jgi:triacylglycerol lipase